MDSREDQDNADATAWRRARWGVYGAFFVAGAALASWVPYIPLVQRRLGLGDGDLGAALFAMTAGALAGVVASGTLIERIGSKAVTAIVGTLFCLLLPAPVFAGSFWGLAIALFAFGSAFGMLDVAMNAQAAKVQRAAGRPLMSGFHGLYSVGGMAGSGVAGLLLSREVAPAAHIAGVVVAMAALCGLSSMRLLATPAGEKRGGPALSLPAGAVVGMSVLAFLIFVGEGAVMDWATVYLANVIGAEAGMAAAGFTAFSTAMAAGRFLGDAATTRLGAMRAGVWSGVLAAAGLAMALASSSLWVAVGGFAVAGLGFANLIPILFSRAAEATPEEPQKGIAGVAGIGYFGLVAGPPAIGFTAEAVGLRGALWFVAGAMTVAAAGLPWAMRGPVRGNGPGA